MKNEPAKLSQIIKKIRGSYEVLATDGEQDTEVSRFDAEFGKYDDYDVIIIEPRFETKQAEMSCGPMLQVNPTLRIIIKK